MEGKRMKGGIAIDRTSSIHRDQGFDRTVIPEGFLSFTESVKSGIVLIWKDRIVHSNQVFVEISGYSLEELANMDFWDLTNEDQRLIARENAMKLLNRDGSSSLEYPLIRKDGTLRWIRVETGPVRWNEQDLLVMTCFDITSSKKIEEDLRESRERLDVIMKGADLATWDWNIVTGEVIFNDKWADILGYELKEIDFSIKTWEELLHPEDMEPVMKVLNDHLEGRSDHYETEHRLKAKDGTWKWIMDSGKVIERDEHGKPLRATGIHMDITERKNVLERMKGSEQKYLAVLEHSPNNIYLVDLGSMMIIEANSTLQELLGYTEEELLGMKPYDFIAHGVDDVNREIEKLPDGQYGFVGPRKYVTKDGKVIDVEVSANLIEYEGRKVISVVSWDVTELKKVQEELMELNEILRLISRITRHDIRNRLTIAVGIMGLMREGYAIEPTLVEEAYKSIRKSIDITKRMNELESLIISGKAKRRIQLHDTIESIVVDYPLKYSINGDCSLVVDDAFSSVVENLVGNSIFHGGADRIIVDIHENDNECMISISDNGTGIPDDIKERIFEESFSYGKNRGTGLGLFIVKKVVERYGGDVLVKDNHPKGTTFEIRLPKKFNTLDEEMHDILEDQVIDDI